MEKTTEEKKIIQGNNPGETKTMEATTPELNMHLTFKYIIM